MTFPNDGICVIKMEHSTEEISAVLAASEQERKRLRKLGKVMETVAAYRLKELQHFQAMEQLAIWRRTHGYDHDDSWMHGPRPVSSPLGGQQERRDRAQARPDERGTIRASAEQDAVHRSGSRELLPRT